MQMIPWLLLAPCLIAPAPKVSPPVVEIRTANCELSEEERTLITATLQAEAALLEDLFGPSSESPSLRVQLHGSFQAFQAFRDSETKAKSRTGFYSPALGLAVVMKQEGYLGVVAHELLHAQLRQRFQSPPTWLNEGLAEYVESSTVQSGQLKAIPQAVKLKRVLATLHHGGFPLKPLVSWEHSQWSQENEAKGHPASTWSWALVTFLLEGPQPRERIRLILTKILQGKETYKVMEEHYPGGFHVLERDLGAWFRLH